MIPLITTVTTVALFLFTRASQGCSPPAPTRAVEPVSGAEYLGLPASQKLSRVWSNCEADSTPSPWVSLVEMLGLMLERMCPTFNTVGDQMPSHWGTQRRKFIHSVGTVGRVEWRALGQHSYTGIFKGASQGIVRLSLALIPDTNQQRTVPGLGLKFLRDGMDSANLVAMFSLEGQDSWNFFKHSFSNHIPRPSILLTPGAAKFSEATPNIQQVGLSDWARYGEDGARVASPQFPYRLRFQPTGDLQFPDTYTVDHTQFLTTIPKGSVLYNVYALDKPGELGGTEEKVAELVLVSDMVTSRWGDKQLFFRHQDMVEDLQERPEWLRFTPRWELWPSSTVGEPKCQGWLENLGK